MRIDVGSGDFPKPGYASVDKYSPRADYQADFINLPFPNNSIQEVYTSQTLEHLSKEEVPLALGEIYRVLQPNGIFTIIVPDLEYCVQLWLKDKESRGFPLDVIFGNQNHAGEFHKTGFTIKTLKSLIEEAGLKVTKIENISDHSVLSIIAQGYKDDVPNLQ